MLTDRLLSSACGRRSGALDEAIVERIISGMPQHRHGLRSLVEAVETSEVTLRRWVVRHSHRDNLPGDQPMETPVPLHDGQWHQLLAIYFWPACNK